jgi:hypothetical protein
VIGDVALRRGLVLVVAVVDDLQDLDGTERGAEAAQGRELVGSTCATRPMMPAAGLGQQRGSKQGL